MSTNVQYNTPMPLYSREAAEEQYTQQMGSGPAHAIGSNNRHFDPEKSETLKAIRDDESGNFGHATIAHANGHAASPSDYEWTRMARNRSEQARSVTPVSMHTTTPGQQHYAMHYSTTPQQTGLLIEPYRQYVKSGGGYEFGGLDFVDRSRIKADDDGMQSYSVGGRQRRETENRHMPPGYQMGATDYGKAAVYSTSPYHGHGPERRKLQPHFEKEVLKHNEMNIELAPNVESVSADILVGDTISNQHLHGDQHFDTSFGTWFGPITRKDDRYGSHGRRNRSVQPRELAPFGLATNNYQNYSKNEQATAIRSSSNAPDEWHKSGGEHRPVAADNYLPYRASQDTSMPKRSQSAAPVDRYQWSSGGDGANRKEVTIGTLLNDKALDAPRTSVHPEWHTRSLEKTIRWKNGSDLRLSRPQIYESEPTWSKIVSSRRNAWEEKARNVDAHVQMPPTFKVVAKQPPYWYNKANQTHLLWQSEADRQSQLRPAAGYNDSFTSEANRVVHGYDQRAHAADSHQTHPSHHYTTTRETSGSSSQQHLVQQPHVHSSQTTAINQQHNAYDSISRPTALHASESREHKLLEELRGSGGEEGRRSGVPLGTERSSYQYSTHHESTAPLASTTTLITKSGGDFDRRAEMAETLPHGTIANTEANTEGNYVDSKGLPIAYKREIVSSLNPHSESTLLKEEERRIVETPLEPGVISRHVTTKYYKKKTVTDTSTIG